MLHTRVSKVLMLSLTAALLAAGVLGAQERPGDKGETATGKKLRGRSAAPKAGEIDSAVTLDAMLSKRDKSGFSEEKGATVEGYVVQVEREEDGDYHLTLAPSGGETDTKKWVIVEITPTWQKKGAAFSGDSLRKLYGKKVKVTGWLYYEPDEAGPDPRGTRWEIHPVTEIQAVP
ncbi:MAG TPA: hypothetical protein VGO79_16410 [Thermoanaerobaculia bacterium]|jgi:hypothetical protein